MGNLQEYLPFLIPLVVIQLGLMLASIVHILRHETYRFGNRVFWIIVCLLVGIIGPVLYFTYGREEE